MLVLLLIHRHNYKWYFTGGILYLLIDITTKLNNNYFWRTLSVYKSIGIFITDKLTNNP
jgi:hypothetical protein